MNMLGRKIKFKHFSYTNLWGGTGMTTTSKPDFETNVQFNGVATGKVVKNFCDYETGWVYHVVLDPKSWEVIKNHTKENKVYVSEFDLAPCKPHCPVC